jgi:hypothetical protein
VRIYFSDSLSLSLVPEMHFGPNYHCCCKAVIKKPSSDVHFYCSNKEGKEDRRGMRKSKTLSVTNILFELSLSLSLALSLSLFLSLSLSLAPEMHFGPNYHYCWKAVIKKPYFGVHFTPRTKKETKIEGGREKAKRCQIQIYFSYSLSLSLSLSLSRSRDALWAKLPLFLPCLLCSLSFSLLLLKPFFIVRLESVLQLNRDVSELLWSTDQAWTDTKIQGVRVPVSTA